MNTPGRAGFVRQQRQFAQRLALWQNGRALRPGSHVVAPHIHARHVVHLHLRNGTLTHKNRRKTCRQKTSPMHRSSPRSVVERYSKV
ncbi:hypothetical protein [Mesorhizobium loti]|uniref:hypothetical protein n=1 Tax=Rhizobium loti TaxID=381 RepID=UPI001FD98DC0|nr:hypothetical protein [Mesorhizobium loti]